MLKEKSEGRGRRNHDITKKGHDATLKTKKIQRLQGRKEGGGVNIGFNSVQGTLITSRRIATTNATGRKKKAKSDGGVIVISRKYSWGGGKSKKALLPILYTLIG